MEFLSKVDRIGRGIQRLLLGMLLLGILFFVFAQVSADEGTAEPDDSSAVVIVEAGDDVPVVDETEPMTWLQWFQVVIGTSTLLLLISVAYQSWRSGGDTGLSTRVDEIQDNRPVVERGEGWYQKAPEKFQIAFNNTSELMQFIGYMTNLQTPESIARLMKDIQVPGAPDTPAPETDLLEARREAAH